VTLRHFRWQLPKSFQSTQSVQYTVCMCGSILHNLMAIKPASQQISNYVQAHNGAGTGRVPPSSSLSSSTLTSRWWARSFWGLRLLCGDVTTLMTIFANKIVCLAGKFAMMTCSTEWLVWPAGGKVKVWTAWLGLGWIWSFKWSCNCVPRPPWEWAN